MSSLLLLLLSGRFLICSKNCSAFSACLELPGAISEGDTLEELKANMIDAITLVVNSINKEAQDKQRMVIEVPV
jgi:hypothetical protein